MDVKFDKVFSKDLKKLKNRDLALKLKQTIAECKAALALSEINQIKKLKGYQNYYRIRIGDYRIGLEIRENTLIFIRCLHRREIYRFFP